MKPINVCVPVLKRYDLLTGLLKSLDKSTMPPDAVYIIDNGQKPSKMIDAVAAYPRSISILTPPLRLGLAEAWNWFIDHVPDERFIVNDDIIFAPDSIEKMVANNAPFVSCSFGFSCFLLRNECVVKVGKFDEEISPGYAYFEDRDYLNRMRLANIQDGVVLCGVEHLHSQTPAAYTSIEMLEHNKKFIIAQENFLKKWGQLPPDVQRQFA